MKIKYYSAFSKKRNSTKIPTGGTEVDVYLKESTSILNPVFITKTIPDTANYIYCGDFGRYYFVTDIVHVTATNIEIHCSCDVLATYKSAIGSYTGNVEYTASSQNTDITDYRNKPTYILEEKVTDSADLSTKGFSDSGCYIVGISSNEGLYYYKLSSAEFTSMCAELYNISNAASLSNEFYNITNCIVSCIWSAYVPDSAILSLQPVTIGGDPLATPQITPLQLGSFYRITQRCDSIDLGTTAIGFPSDDHGIDFCYLDVAPYTNGSVYLPFVGCVPFDVDLYAPNKSITMSMIVDHFTGDVSYIMRRASGDTISTYQGSCATNVPISSMSRNEIGRVSSVISAVTGFASLIAGAATQNPMAVVGGVAAMANAGLNQLQSSSFHTQTNGSISSALSTKMPMKIRFTVFTKRPTTWQLEEFRYISGMPYFKAAQISSLSGYVQCAGAFVDIPGYESEKNEVNSFLNSGFYYE